MISEVEMIDLATFVLKFLNCKRDCSIYVLKHSQYVQFHEDIKAVQPSLHDTFEEEHGSEYARKVRSGEWELPCATTVQSNEKPEETRFCILIFEKYFSKLSRPLQMLNIIHETRHIAEWPRLLSEKEYGNLDAMLLREYLKGKGFGKYHSTDLQRVCSVEILA